MTTNSPLRAADAVSLTRALTRIDSRNPTLAAGAPGEAIVARELAGILSQWGFDVTLTEAAPSRPNLIARIGPQGSPALMFAGHLDTVEVEGMTHDPFSGELRDGRIYGRGSADMKSGVAAMCSAAFRAREACGGNPKRQIIVAAVADEECESLGMRALIEGGIAAERAILTEPTRLAICPAHRGFAWFEIDFEGRAAHGSRYDIGVDAITHAALVLAELDQLETHVLHSRTHPLLGRGSLHASKISGGTGMSTYPDHCAVSIERRTLPGDTADSLVREVHDAFEKVRQRHPELNASVRFFASQAASDVTPDSPVVKSLERALALEAIDARIEGMSAWTDAALLNEAGIPAVCFGPGDIGLAHAREEYVPVSEIEQATAVLSHVATEWMTGRDA